MYEIYQIKYGDTLETIADSYGISIDELYKINKNISTDVDSYIIVPAVNNGALGIYRVRKGDTPYLIAKQYNIPIDLLMTLNGLNKDDYIYPDQQLIVPGRDMKIYITKEGDTLNKVENNLDDSLDEIIRQNNNIYLLPDQLIMYKKEVYDK